MANAHAQANGIPTAGLNVKIDKYKTRLIALYLKQNIPLAAKPVISRDMGRYVYPVQSKANFDLIASIPGSYILFQNYTRFEKLVRTIVSRDKFLCEATTFDHAHDNWKASVCNNPAVQPYRHVPKKLSALAEATIRAFGGNVAFIDHFQSQGDFFFNEINHSCGMHYHELATASPSLTIWDAS